MNPSNLNIDNIPGMLSDTDIKHFWNKGIYIFTSESGELAFDLERQLQLGSIDLRFRHDCKRISISKGEVLTYERLKNHDYTVPFEIQSGKNLTIAPGEMILTTTLETVQLSEDFAGIITGRSSIARLGIMVHCCQEYINPGHGQPIPLQLVNLGPCTVELDLSVPVCQLVIFKLRNPASGRYIHEEKAKYSSEVGPENSKIYEEMNSAINSPAKIRKTANLKKTIGNYLLPFLPSLIMTTGITPFISNYINGKSVLDLTTAVQSMPLPTLLCAAAFFLYIWLKRGNNR